MQKVILTICFLFLATSSLAETIALTNGDTIEVSITDRGDDYIEVNKYGVQVTYWLDEVVSIDGQAVNGKQSTKEEIKELLSDDQDTLTNSSVLAVIDRTVSADAIKIEYTNDQLGIRLSYPAEWKLFDSTENIELYQYLIQNTNSNFLACGFLIGENIEEMEAMILINREPLPANLAGASIQDLLMIQQQHMNSLSNEEKQAITQFPQLDKLGNNDVMFSSLNSEGMSQNNYQLIHDSTVINIGFSGVNSIIQDNQTKIEDMIASMYLSKVNSFDSQVTSDNYQDAAEGSEQILNLNIGQDWQEYRNAGAGFNLKHPGSWKVYDRDLNPEEFNRLGNETQLRYVVSALTPSADINYPMPLMLIQPVSLPVTAKGLVGKAALEAVWNENPPQIKQAVIKQPEIIKLSNFDAIYYVANPSNGFLWEIIDIIQGDLVYKVSLMADEQLSMENKEQFEAIVASIQFFNPRLASTGRPIHPHDITSLFWTVLALLGGIVVLRNPRANNIFAIFCFLYALCQLYYLIPSWIRILFG